MIGPYESAALDYLQAGWSGILPIEGKYPPPRGYTGTKGAWPSAADVMSWCDGPEGSRNLGLRLPEHVIGIDVDDYDDKTGGATFADAEAVWGPLPPTWVSTSRSDGTSGIRLYTVPVGLRWPGQLGAGVELIQWKHRYVMAWPSIHPSERVYQWIDPLGIEGVQHGDVPHADDLPAMPEAWVHGLTGGEAETELAKIELPDDAVAMWIEAIGKGEPCPAVLRALARAEAELLTKLSRHDTTMRASARLALLAVEGHSGAAPAMTRLGVLFGAAVGHDPEREHGEYRRMLSGAVKIAAARPPQPLDPCSLWRSPPSAPAPSSPTATAPVPHLSIVPKIESVKDPAPSTNTFYETDENPAVVQAIFDAAPKQLTAPPPVNPIDNPQLALELSIQRARREARRILDHEEHTKAFREPPYEPTLTRELALPDELIKFRIAEVLPTGGNVLFTAQFKSGKTTLINHLGRCLADEQPLFGALDVAKLDGRIALFNYEVSRGQYRRWLRDLGVQNTDKIVVLNLRGYSLPLSAPHATEWVVRWLAERDVCVWVLDPWARAAVGSITNENDNTEASQLLDHLDVIKSRASVAELIVSTHTGRAEVEEGRERARGATRLDDWADVRWFLNRDETGQRFFMATGRDVEYPEKLLAYDEKSRNMTIAGGSRAITHSQTLRNSVMAVVMNTPGVSGNGIRRGVRATMGKAGNEAINDALAEVIEAGLVIVKRVSQTDQHFLPSEPRNLFS